MILYIQKKKSSVCSLRGLRFNVTKLHMVLRKERRPLAVSREKGAQSILTFEVGAGGGVEKKNPASAIILILLAPF